VILAGLIIAHFVGLIVLIWRDPAHLLESHRNAQEKS